MVVLPRTTFTSKLHHHLQDYVASRMGRTSPRSMSKKMAMSGESKFVRNVLKLGLFPIPYKRKTRIKKKLTN